MEFCAVGWGGEEDHCCVGLTIQVLESLNERLPAHLPFPTTFLNVTDIIRMILQFKKIIIVAFFLFINPIRVVVCRGQHNGSSSPIRRPSMIPMPIINNLRRSREPSILTRSLLARRRRLRARLPRLGTIHPRGRFPSRRLPPHQPILLPRRRR